MNQAALKSIFLLSFALQVQDHFGLNNADILKVKFRHFYFFRIWFVLQRYSQFGFKPFMTNMEATVEITGERNETKK